MTTTHSGPVSREEGREILADFLQDTFNDRPDTQAAKRIFEWHVGLLEDMCEYIEDSLTDPSFKALDFVRTNAARTCRDEQFARLWLLRLRDALDGYVRAIRGVMGVFRASLTPELDQLARRWTYPEIDEELTAEEKDALRKALSDSSFDPAAFSRLTLRHSKWESIEDARAFFEEVSKK